MITLTIEKEVKSGKTISRKREIQCFRSMDKAKQVISPIVAEMRMAKKTHVQPKTEITAVSYDSESEKTMLLEMRAIESNDNEE